MSNLLNTSGQNLSLTSELLKCWASFQTSLPAGIYIIGNVCITDKDPFLVSVVEATIPDIIDEVNIILVLYFLLKLVNRIKLLNNQLLKLLFFANLGYLHLFRNPKSSFVGLH